MLNWGGILHFPGMQLTWGNAHQFGVDVVGFHAKNWGADVIMPHMDLWPLRGLSETLRAQSINIPFVPWFPVDMAPLPPPVREMAKTAFRRIVFSRFGERMVNEAGLDCYYVPHGYNSETYKPKDRTESRKAMNLPEDAFVVGIVAANQGNPSRKSWNEMLEAFAQFKRKHPDAMLYLHTHVEQRQGGVNLIEAFEYFGLEAKKDVAIVDQYQYVLGLPEDQMATMYSAFDVLMNVSQGEGFGIPILEAQACGTPVIVGDWTSMSELCMAGWAVPMEDATRWRTPLGAYQWIPHVGAIVEALEQAYDARGNEKLRKKAATKATYYDADRITERYWKPVLKDIDAAIKASREPKDETTKLIVPDKPKLVKAKPGLRLVGGDT